MDNSSLGPGNMPGIVYVLSNPAMPRLVKIGCTSNEVVKPRLDQLYSTGLPFPFEVEFAAKVPNPEEVEQALHQAFAPNRVNPRREFFELDAAQPVAILRLLHVEDATWEVAQQAMTNDPQDAAAADNFRARRPPLDFLEMGIPVGSTLNFTKREASAQVTAAKKVSLEGTEMSLTAATRQLLAIQYNVAPGPYWMVNGKTISAIYDETYQHPSLQ
jgi:hypothetical protein